MLRNLIAFCLSRRPLALVAFAAFLGIGGIWTASFLKNLGSKPLVPLNDPRFAVAMPA